jgi:hypothetical protein
MFNTSFLRSCWLALVLILFASAEVAGQARLAWDPATDPAVTGYMVAFGPSHANYTTRIDVGNRTTYDMPALPDGTYYVAVQGYTKTGSNSAFSNEITVVITSTLASATAEQKRSDFDHDGQSDILWQNIANGQLAAWALQGTKLKTESGVVPGIVSDLNWRIAGSGDFNGDGRPDIVWHNKSDGAAAVWYMSGLKYLGHASFSIPNVTDTAWKIAGVADFNADGHPDVLWQHDTGPLKLWTMNKTTVTSEGMYFTNLVEEPEWRVAGALDVNSDGKADILWRHSTGWLATWIMNGMATLTDAKLLDPMSEPDPVWRIAGYIDANQDGKLDILWQNEKQGTIRIWLMDGLKRIQTTTISAGSMTGATWKVVAPK